MCILFNHFIFSFVYHGQEAREITLRYVIMIEGFSDEIWINYRINPSCNSFRKQYWKIKTRLTTSLYILQLLGAFLFSPEFLLEHIPIFIYLHIVCRSFLTMCQSQMFTNYKASRDFINVHCGSCFLYIYIYMSVQTSNKYLCYTATIVRISGFLHL